MFSVRQMLSRGFASKATVRTMRTVRETITRRSVHVHSTLQRPRARITILITAAGAALATPLLCFPAVECSIFGGDAHESKKTSPVLAKADTMYDQGSWNALYQWMRVAKEDTPEDPEVLWRFARAAYEFSEQPDLPTKQVHALRYEAFEATKAGLVFGPDNYKCHLWYGIMLNAIGDLEGSKAKITNLVVVKGHWLKATELNPNDATSWHLLGRWCKGIVEISWLNKQIAQAIFGRIPPSSYGEALVYFERAEQIDPGFWLKNQLAIAECMIALERKEEGKKWLERALRVKVKTEEDKVARKDVEKLLKKHFDVKH